MESSEVVPASDASVEKESAASLLERYGIGELAKTFEEAGLSAASDLLMLTPRKYEQVGALKMGQQLRLSTCVQAERNRAYVQALVSIRGEVREFRLHRDSTVTDRE